MSSNPYPIPERLNLVLAVLISLLCTGLLIATGFASNWLELAGLALGYGLVMNSGYALCHEAEHDIFHSNKRINDLAGAGLCLFFPASFQLRRQGHIGHHLRNRSDEEAFDLYCVGDNRLWKFLQFYGILTGLFWVVILLSNILALIHPPWLSKLRPGFDRATVALQETLNPRYNRWIQLEALSVFVFHGTIIVLFHIPLTRYLLVLFGFGFLWSTLQYIHHYGTSRDVQEGARNLGCGWVLGRLWLNHELHLNHHLHPTVSWVYLPLLTSPSAPPATPMWKAYLEMWKGPRPTTEIIPNRHASRLIK